MLTSTGDFAHDTDVFIRQGAMGFMSFDRKDTAKQLHLSETVARAIAARPLPGERASHAESDRPAQQCLGEPFVDESASLGPLDALMGDPQITDILVNRYDRIYVERNGRLELTKIVFRDNPHLRQIIDRIVGRVGRRIDETQSRWWTPAWATAAA